jgi:tetratricopeptide (TPR) repeat protein
MKYVTRALWSLGAFALLAFGPAVGSARAQAPDTTAGQGEMSQAKKLYMKGVEFMNSSRYLDAVEQFQLALDEDPNYDDARKTLAFVYTQMGNSEPDYYQDALDVYKELEKRLPANDIEVRKNIAFVQGAMGNIDDAIATYKEILGITPDDCGIYMQIGTARRAQAEQAKASAAAAQGVAGGDNPEYTQKIDEAVQAFTKVTELCPDSLTAFRTLGEIYFGADRKTDAAGIYEKLVENDPKDMDALTKLAYIYQNDKDWPKAIPVYEKILAVDPTQTQARKNYAIALQKAGKVDAAAAQFQKLIDEDPSGNADLYCNLCMLYAFDAGDGDKAAKVAMQGISVNAPLQPCLTVGWTKGLELKGTALVKEGQYDRAISTYKEAKLKAAAVLGDKNFGKAASQLIDRLDKLIVIAEQTREKAKER